MLAELAAANAAFGIIKNFVSNGKELSGCVKQISDFVFSKDFLNLVLAQQKRVTMRSLSPKVNILLWEGLVPMNCRKIQLSKSL